MTDIYDLIIGEVDDRKMPSVRQVVTVRVPMKLYTGLQKEAAARGCSLNTLAVAKLMLKANDVALLLEQTGKLPTGVKRPRKKKQPKVEMTELPPSLPFSSFEYDPMAWPLDTSEQQPVGE